MEVVGVTTKQAGLALLVQFLMGGISVCHRDFLGYSDLLHCSIPLHNFVAGNRFVNPGENPACPAGEISMWTTIQGEEYVGERIASVDANLTALDSRNAVADQIARTARVHLQTISRATNLQREIGTKTYILSKLFGNTCPLVQGYASIVTWIDENFASFEHHVSTTALCTSFAYNLSRIEATYYNVCIRASTTALMGDHGGITLVSFAMLLDKLTWGQYLVQPLPVSLQSLLHPANAPCTTHTVNNIATPSVVPASARVDSQNAQGRGATRDGDPITNPAPIPHLHLLQGKNTGDTLCSSPLPTINRCTFCKRWHLGMTCWTRCARVASHVPPTNSIVNKAAAALTAERAGAAAAAQP